MRALCGLDTVPDTVFNDAYAAVLEVQGRGSGTDVAACVLGGITRYRMQPREMETMSLDLPLLLVYCGYKTPTVEVIERLDAERCRFPRVYERIFDALDACSVAGWDALRAGNIESFGQIMDIHQGLMETMALSTPELDEIIAALRALPGVMGAKITGSGLGDCALAVGAGPWKHDKYEQLPVAISREGVTIDY
jgi:mevalonate kinase